MLEVADLGGDALERPARHRHRGQKRGMAVALDDLSGDGISVEAEPGKHLILEIRVQVAVGAHRPGDLAGGRVVRGG